MNIGTGVELHFNMLIESVNDRLLLYNIFSVFSNSMELSDLYYTLTCNEGGSKKTYSRQTESQEKEVTFRAGRTLHWNHDGNLSTPPARTLVTVPTAAGHLSIQFSFNTDRCQTALCQCPHPSRLGVCGVKGPLSL